MNIFIISVFSLITISLSIPRNKIPEQLNDIITRLKMKTQYNEELELYEGIFYLPYVNDKAIPIYNEKLDSILSFEFVRDYVIPYNGFTEIYSGYKMIVHNSTSGKNMNAIIKFSKNNIGIRLTLIESNDLFDENILFKHHFKFRFIGNLEYKINAEIVDIDLPVSIEEILNKSNKSVNIVHTARLDNPTNSNIEEFYEKIGEKTLSSTFTISDENKRMFESFWNAGITVKADASFWGIGFSTSVQSQYGEKNSGEKAIINTSSTTKINQESIRFYHKITVLPNTSIKVINWIDWYDSIRIPFKAYLKISGFGSRFNNYNQLSANNLLYIINNKFPLVKSVYYDYRDSYLYIDMNGTIFGSFGLRTNTKLENIHKINDTIANYL